MNFLAGFVLMFLATLMLQAAAAETVSDNYSAGSESQHLNFSQSIPGSLISENVSSPAREIPDISSDERAFQIPYRESAILVRFDPRSDSIPLRTHAALGSRIIHDYSAEGLPGLELIQPPDQLSITEAVSHYQSQPGVLYAEPDYYRFADRVPSDLDFWRQWGLENTGQTYREETPPGTPGSDIQAPAAWDKATGGECIVAVLDSGVDYLHPDLAGNIWVDPETGTSGYDAITGELEPMDLASHGTHCAGIIGAVGDNALGIAGVSWQVKIMPVRFLNSFGTGTVSDEIEAILWATKHGARIISCSYGGTMFSKAEYEVIKQSDALFICAAGNAGVDTDKIPSYPSGHDLSNIISVTATDPHDALASFSNYGQKTVDLGAPGVDIYSTKRAIYQPVPIWTDPFDNLQNWTLHGNWTLDTGQYVSSHSSARGVVNETGPDGSRVPAILTLKSPLKLSGLVNPVISYEWSLVAMNYSFMLEGSTNGITWQPLDYTNGSLIIAPFMRRQCKIPQDMRDGHLFIRFETDGPMSILGLDDISLSDGYGNSEEIRWGYMNGTSMACPQVTGIAALLASAAPDASLAEIRNSILTTVHPAPSLKGRTVTGGRADLAASLDRITGGSAYHLHLKTGWNHVSIPHHLIPGNDSARNVFGSLTNVSGHSLYRFESGNWISIRPEERITPLTSYWIFTGQNASLPLMTDTNQSGIFTRNLTTGWNGIGLTGEEPVQAKEALRSLADIWTYIVGFNATTQTSDEPIIRGGSGTQSDSRLLLPYHGYWIYLTRNSSLEKNGSGENMEAQPGSEITIGPGPLK